MEITGFYHQRRTLILLIYVKIPTVASPIKIGGHSKRPQWLLPLNMGIKLFILQLKLKIVQELFPVSKQEATLKGHGGCFP